MRKRAGFSRVVVVSLIAAMGFACMGCGYLRNIRDDVLDIGDFAVGVNAPTLPGGEKPVTVGWLPPALGLHLQATQFICLGGLYKHTGDLSMEGRGYGIVVDHRVRYSFLMAQHVFIKQTPVVANAYKRPESELQGWRDTMMAMEDPVFHCPANITVYVPKARDRNSEEPPEHLIIDPESEHLPFFHRGWHHWVAFSVELALPEPFILHSGFYVRAGLDPSQVFDLVLTILGLDFYGDSAYTFVGDLKYPTATAASSGGATSGER